MRFLKQYGTVIIYGCVLALLFLALKLAEYRLLIVDHSTEIYAGSIALLFLLVGIWVARKLFVKTTSTIIETERIIEKTVAVPAAGFVLDAKALQQTGLSSREMEVLQLVAAGMSNQEIASALYVSLSTVKTHMANIFFKLDATRRTQAVEKAKRLRIIA